MPNTFNNEVVFSEGEALLASDLMKTQEFLRALIIDQLTAADSRRTDADTSPLLDTAAGYTKGNAPSPYTTGTGLSAKNVAGLLLQRVSSVDGLTPAVLAYQCSQDEFTFTATPDPSNPRYMGIFYKLATDDTTSGSSETRDFEDAVTRVNSSQSTYKKRRVTCTTSVVHGTAAATPALPATPAGYVPWGYIYLPAAATNLAAANVACALYPLGFRRIFVPAKDLWVPANYTVGTDGRVVAGASSWGEYRVLAPIGPTERIVRMDVHRFLNGGSNDTIGVYQFPLTGGLGSPASPFPATVATPGFVAGQATKTYDHSSADKLPLWGDGTMSGPQSVYNAAAATQMYLSYFAANNGDVLKGFSFYVCGGK